MDSWNRRRIFALSLTNTNIKMAVVSRGQGLDQLLRQHGRMIVRVITQNGESYRRYDRRSFLPPEHKQIIASGWEYVGKSKAYTDESGRPRIVEQETFFYYTNGKELKPKAPEPKPQQVTEKPEPRISVEVDGVFVPVDHAGYIDPKKAAAHGFTFVCSSTKFRNAKGQEVTLAEPFNFYIKN